MQDGDTRLTLLFRFNAGGLENSLHAEARGALMDGVNVPTPWEGRWSRYELRDGMRVPMEGENKAAHSDRAAGPGAYRLVRRRDRCGARDPVRRWPSSAMPSRPANDRDQRR